MNPCSRFAPMIGARPGDLSPEDARAFAEHVGACDACQARVADEAALSGMLFESLMAEASARDFAAFSDGVLERIPAYRAQGGTLSRLRRWTRRHRVAAVASVLAPALAAAALVVYLLGGSPEPGSVELSAEGRNELVLQTSDGPVVLFGDTDGT